MLEAYLEFLITGFLNSKAPLYSSDGEVVSNLVGYFTLFITCVVMPLTFIWILTKPIQATKEHKFEEKWGKFYHTIKMENKTNMLFYLIFMLRRLIFVLIIFGGETSVLQI